MGFVTVKVSCAVAETPEELGTVTWVHVVHVWLAVEENKDETAVGRNSDNVEGYSEAPTLETDTSVEIEYTFEPLDKIGTLTTVTTPEHGSVTVIVSVPRVLV